MLLSPPGKSDKECMEEFTWLHLLLNKDIALPLKEEAQEAKRHFSDDEESYGFEKCCSMQDCKK